MALPKLTSVSTLETSGYDGAVIIFSDIKSIQPPNARVSYAATIQHYASIDKSFGEEVILIADVNAPGGRLVLAPTGSLNDDVDDVRRFFDVANKATKRAITAGIRKPLFYFADPPLENNEQYEKFVQVTLLGALDAAFQQLTFREHSAKIGKPWRQIDEIGIVLEGLLDSSEVSDSLFKTVIAIEEGKRVVKDLGSPDPERMSPLNFTNYVRETFEDCENIHVTVIDDLSVIAQEYPLLYAVTRASLPVKRHHPRVVKLEYKSPEQSKVKENLFFVGKGVTYDTGGADIKAGGHMRGMSRDKCGAATVAGFLKTVSKLNPENINVTGALALVRNSVGSDSYVSDEVIYSRAGVRVLVGNTDAEGRMVMTDLLAEFKDLALNSNSNIPSRLFTVATLTGHAWIACGTYGVTLDNGPARKAGISDRVARAGHIWGDPFEISTLRRDDYKFVEPGSNREDVVQANDRPSTQTSRGHQFPAAFMIIASGLNNNSLKAPKEKQLCYTHLDIAGNSEVSAEGLSLGTVTGYPITALAGAFL
ncbi:hypothetical protein G9A89_021339 [Geosiphon pyriformis]|nr:hypothetical protein G9A89_021339 [Geosiphon pyriformis]